MLIYKTAKTNNFKRVLCQFELIVCSVFVDLSQEFPEASQNFT